MSGDEVENRKEKALESGPLERLFGGSATARILDFMVVFKEWDYSKMDIAKNSDVSFRHVLREIPRLENLGIVKQTRRVGRAVMYQFNKNSSTGKAVKELASKIGMLEAEKIAEEEGKIILKPIPTPEQEFGSLKTIFKGKSSRNLLKEARQEESAKDEKRRRHVGATGLRL